MTATATQTVREIVHATPSTARVFESFGIDYCCGGKLPLSDACDKAGVSGSSLLTALDQLLSQPQDARDWTGASFSDLTAHIVSRHHGYVRKEAPRLLAFLEKVIARHGVLHPEVTLMRERFMVLQEELFFHMRKEEQILFPYLVSMEAAKLAGEPLPHACFGSVRQPIAAMIAEHDNAGRILGHISTLSNGFTPPPNACTTFIVLYSGLADFARDLDQHVHLENNILFPRAV